MNDSLGFAQVVADPLKISLKPFEAKSPNGKKDKKAKNDFAKVLHSEITNGFVSNRNQIIGFMKRNGVDVEKVGTDFITVRLHGAQKNTRLKGPLFAKDSDYAAIVADHHQAKIPRFLSYSEAQEQKDKLVAGIEARTAFNQRRYLTPKPGANRNRATAKSSQPRPDTKHKQVKEHQPGKDSAGTLDKHLVTLKEQADPATTGPQANLPHRVARRNDDKEQASTLPSVMGSALGGLEAQIGSMSMQYHSLLLMLASAKGPRASKLKSQIMIIEQKLAALNLELEKKKLQATDPNKPIIH